MNYVKFKGEDVPLGGSRLKEGDLAPNFVLVDRELENVTLENFEGKTKVVSVVPSLDTSVCLMSTKKMNDLAKEHPDFAFIIVSADLPFAQSRICTGEKLENLHFLSMMRSKAFAESYGLLIDEGPLAGLASRCVLVLDEKDRIIYIEVVEEITSEPNYESLEASLRQ
ncbi:MAG: thiol peroxidase [Simkaniaceae bacterium]|nr:thiol peroxidase [Simkaniaceae bacterium]